MSTSWSHLSMTVWVATLLTFEFYKPLLTSQARSQRSMKYSTVLYSTLSSSSVDSFSMLREELSVNDLTLEVRRESQLSTGHTSESKGASISIGSTQNKNGIALEFGKQKKNKVYHLNCIVVNRSISNSRFYS